MNLLFHQKLDNTNRGAVRERIVPPVDVLINAPAYTGVDRVESKLEIARRVSAVGGGLLVGRYAALNIPMMHLSTDYVFGGKADSLSVRSVEHVTRHGDPQVWGTYHYCGQPATTWFHFARRIFEAARKLRGAVTRLKPRTASEYPVESDTRCTRHQTVLKSLERWALKSRLGPHGWQKQLAPWFVQER